MTATELVNNIQESMPPDCEVVAYEPGTDSLMVHGMGQTNFRGRIIPVLRQQKELFLLFIAGMALRRHIGIPRNG